jgi:hypothetical protein
LAAYSDLVVASPDDPSDDPELEAAAQLGQASYCPTKHLDEDLDAMHDRLGSDPDAFGLK